jgi:hypothetical protein
MKSTMDRSKIDELMYWRERQDWEVGRGRGFKEREKGVVFKEVTNVLEKG